MKYSVIYADPPWLYNDARSSSSMGMARSSYECMSLEDLKNLPVESVAAKNCMLCLWATMPKLQEALDVIKAWGFKYITCGFVWVKLNPVGDGIYSGLGHWCNGNAELVLLAKRGHPKRNAKNVKQIVIEHRGSHSVKPEEVRTRIDALFGDVPKLELFARKSVPGWNCIGNGIDGKNINDALNEINKVQDNVSST